MSDINHTQGPWQFFADLPSTDPNWHIVTNASKMRVIANIHIEPGNQSDMANAHLIAAAPDLLEACKSALRALRMLTVECAIVPSGIVERAIAKAEGRNQ